MNLFEHRVSLDMNKSTSQVYINIRKGDTARKFIFSLSNHGKAYTIAEGCTAVFRAKKPDGTILFNNCVINGSEIEYTVTSQTVSTIGEVECEVTLYGADSKQITSPRFTLGIEDTMYSDDEVESENEFTALLTALAEVCNLDINVSKTDHTSTITIKRKDGTEKSVSIKDGKDGTDGKDGIDGTDGIDGVDGEDGVDGVSPSVSITEISGGHRITITDAGGEKTFDVMDGKDGEGGGAVKSVNGKTGEVNLKASDVGALPDSTQIPTKFSQLSGDSTHRVVTDAEKSTWSGKQDKLTFRIDPEESIYEIDGRSLSAEYDINAERIPDTYARKTDLPAKVSDLENDSKFLTDAPSNNKEYARKNGAWVEIVSGGSTPKRATITLAAAAWENNAQTVTVQGVSADETAQLIQPVPAAASMAAYYDAGVLATGQAANSLTFSCEEVPTADLTVYVVMTEVSA